MAESGPVPVAVFASVVVPAYNEGERLPQMLRELVTSGGTSSSPIEFLVIDDGSRPDHRAHYEDAVAAVTRAWAERGAPHRISLISSARNQGKGASVRLGWAKAAADARWLGFVDADGAVPAHEVWRVIGRAAQEDVDVVAGSRILMAGRMVRRNLVRHAQGRIFATMVEAAFRLGFYDTQCGLKLFRAPLLRSIAPELHQERWMLDVELLVRVRAAGARCIEEPIDWADPGGSKMVPLLDPLRMLVGILRMRRLFQAKGLLPP